jgi:ABC-type phosphate/phosphonate transport system substrate-binding protein
MHSRHLAVLVVCAAFIAPTHAADPFIKDATANVKSTKTGFSPSPADKGPLSSTRSADPDTLVFTSPPRESPAEGVAIYGPVANYLSKVLGKKVVYRHPGTWGAYRSEMLRGDYDIVFDGPHFVGYRAERLHHNALVKLPGRLDFAIVTRKNEKYESLAQMGGRTFCTHAPPNLGTLVLLNQFNNPARQPVIMSTEGWDNIYRGITGGRCVGAVIPVGQLKKLDKDEQLKIVYKSPALPNQGFSAGPRLSLEEQAKVGSALMAPEANIPLEKLRAAHKVSDKLQPATNAEYAGAGEFLRSEFGYY